jgi:hypothetical protein
MDQATLAWSIYNGRPADLPDRCELSFPARFEVVLCHEVNLPQHWFVTAHAGLLFHDRHGYPHVEKCGSSGPFVRLDFSEKAALLIWLGGMFRGAERLG